MDTSAAGPLLIPFEAQERPVDEEREMLSMPTPYSMMAGGSTN